MNNLLRSDSLMRTACVQCGAPLYLPQSAAVSHIGNGNNRDRTFVREECA